MSINYKFNEWRVSGEKATAWSQNAYKLASIEVGRMSGMTIGAVLYLHCVKGMNASEIRKSPVAYGMATATIRGIIRGSYSPEAYSIFVDMLETEPEMLDRLFESA
ncbi:hypothetical protein [Anoxybacillus gonensis]|uniref:hypothetical protein n=1 Tax=Anoxybacillus gonensis TaxID=198467 RepID=UPI0002BE2078|nr:hypothetical protein [Anoxybacillus gonensis]EMI11501.1 hypothetical protein F510_0442 [Anoxybacillus gonensis]